MAAGPRGQSSITSCDRLSMVVGTLLNWGRKLPLVSRGTGQTRLSVRQILFVREGQFGLTSRVNLFGPSIVKGRRVAFLRELTSSSILALGLMEMLNPRAH